jgi:glycosyltransferase involved in cell wall biosynthesis
MSKSVSVILNCFRRPETLSLQIDAIKKQSIQPKELLIWVNGSDKIRDFDYNLLNSYGCAVSNINFGVWSRFAYALNATGDYICVFDDDTIPGGLWLENCLTEINKQEGLYGAIGVIFRDLHYLRYERFGWANPNDETKLVDIVGHSWFFPRHYLSAFWQEIGPLLSSVCGEDMHLSYSIQKYLKAATFVPPHPVDNMSMWGSNPETANKFGIDSNAVSAHFHASHFGQNLKAYYEKGFKLLKI